jgi:lysozyme family protein
MTVVNYPSDFEAWHKILVPSEGKIANRPKWQDTGGLTNMGITFVRFQTIFAVFLGVPATIESFMNLTREQEKSIAYKFYWKDVGVPSALPIYRIILADSFFLGGGVRSLGYTTIAGLNASKSTLQTVANNRLNYLKSLKNWESNKNGWTTRLNNITSGGLNFAKENGIPLVFLLILSSITYLTFKN